MRLRTWHVGRVRGWMLATVAGTLWCCSQSANRALANAEPAAQGPSQVVWQGSRVTAHPASNELVRYAAEQLRKYLESLTGKELTFVPVEKLETMPRQKALFVLGSIHDLRRIAGAPRQFLEEVGALKPDGFAVRTLGRGDAPVILIGARDGAGVLYGVYDVLERLGCFFQTTGDMEQSGG